MGTVSGKVSLILFYTELFEAEEEECLVRAVVHLGNLNRTAERESVVMLFDWIANVFVRVARRYWCRA